MKKNKKEPTFYNWWNNLSESKYKNEWKIPTKKDLKQIKKSLNEE